MYKGKRGTIVDINAKLATLSLGNMDNEIKVFVNDLKKESKYDDITMQKKDSFNNEMTYQKDDFI